MRFDNQGPIQVYNKRDFSPSQLIAFRDNLVKQGITRHETYHTLKGDPDADQSVKPGEKPDFKRFSQYGKGILNIKNALLYAFILNLEKQKGVRSSPVEIRKKMLKMLRAEQEFAAKTIQRAYRKKEQQKS
ncbi:MAG: hypothetical protein A2977_01710 [Alphaproteobacteria bacterium RIFCSPLOWO2_01_FULL_45_8]|nr:MAG: hypothetical protein A2065_04715 [Alphaproteobacteria bacterium GWB1_45_5]OFW76116.1 MAG: hypothetical protein A3K20_03245 [Alphaproteobacteria bacterium GWA1_45_9]OFW90223.1 MAG: hypothetical protein A2621_04500 [Alphaproteobacteria bacterium RIFCSPHIGHO2_01_FULL_41_14]OFW95815.1 MAG: hypothetical protein A2977_01710 [Alphaproteobacteria bacterium RIFCSPLOWO2_01_FULL_45_8]